MKHLKIFSILAMLILACTTFVACGSDDDDNEGGSGNSLSGYWTTSPDDFYKGYKVCRGLYFQNSNTVITYEYVVNGRYWSDQYGDFSVAFPGKSGWYVQDGAGYSRSYVVLNNKIVISNGMTLTISGNKLIPDGGSASEGYTKCN